MHEQLYQPFRRLNFSKDRCFLSGAKLTSTEENLNVFAPWLIAKFNLDERPFKLLDESYLSYSDIKYPCSVDTAEVLEKLEDRIETAFSKGYEEVILLAELHLFQWIGKTMYGVILKEIQTAIKQQSITGEAFQMSQGLIHKFEMLHNMLQSLIRLISFDGFKPWSIFICKVDNAEQEFSYRDEINTLTFSLRMQDFGIIMCLQDNGANEKYQEDIWDKIKTKTLHPVQFEEFCGKVFYAAYLFNRLPEYHVLPTTDQIFIEAMPLKGMTSKPVFDVWQNKTYGQVLESFWKKWGFVLLEIIKDPENPMSFLFDTDGNFKPAKSIDLIK